MITQYGKCFNKAEALIAPRWAGIERMMELMIQDFSSIWLRISVHYVLHSLDKLDLLNESEHKVLTSLEEAEPECVLPWAAAAVLEEKRTGNKPWIYKNQEQQF